MVRGEAATSNWTVYTLQNQAQPELERKEKKGREGEKKRKEERKKEIKMLNKNFHLTLFSSQNVCLFLHNFPPLLCL